jgi:hypothetical protein
LSGFGATIILARVCSSVTGVKFADRGNIVDILEELKRLYFTSLLLSIKSSFLLSGNQVGVPTGDLQTEIDEKNIPWQKWPNYFSDRMTGEWEPTESSATKTKVTMRETVKIGEVVGWENFPQWCARPDLLPEKYQQPSWTTLDLSGYSLTSVF